MVGCWSITNCANMTPSVLKAHYSAVRQQVRYSQIHPRHQSIYIVLHFCSELFVITHAHRTWKTYENLTCSSQWKRDSRWFSLCPLTGRTSLHELHPRWSRWWKMLKNGIWKFRQSRYAPSPPGPTPSRLWGALRCLSHCWKYHHFQTALCRLEYQEKLLP